MSPLSGIGAGLLAGLLVGGVLGAKVEGWRSTAVVATKDAEVAGERELASDNARRAEVDQRAIEYNRLEANADVSYKTRTALDAAAAADRDRDATITGLRNVIAAADAKAGRGQAGIDPGARTGADDAATLRVVASECTAAFDEMAGNAVGAGIAVTGLQGYALAIRPAGASPITQ